MKKNETWGRLESIKIARSIYNGGEVDPKPKKIMPGDATEGQKSINMRFGAFRTAVCTKGAILELRRSFREARWVSRVRFRSICDPQ